MIILLIAPLGLATVVVNTILVTIATYVTATVADRVVHYLSSDAQRANLLYRTGRSQIQHRAESNEIDRLP